MSQKKYDEGYKKLFKTKHSFIHFLQKYIGAPWTYDISEEHMELCNPEFIMGNYKKRNADVIWRIYLPTHGTFVYIIQELQSNPDYSMPYRTLVYTMNMILHIFESTDKAARRKKDFQLPVVMAVVLYNGDKSWNTPTCFSNYQKKAELFGTHAVNFEYYFVNLRHLDEGFILNSNTLVDNILAIDKMHTQDAWIEKLGDISIRVKKLLHDEQMQFWIWVEKVLAVTAVNKKSISSIIAVLQEEEEDTMTSALARIINKEFSDARRKGHREGHQEGRQEGRQEGFAAAENNFRLLFQHLTESGEQDLFLKALEDSGLKNELFKKYNIS